MADTRPGTRINIKLPPDVHKAAKEHAETNGQTLKGWVIAVLKAVLKLKNESR